MNLKTKTSKEVLNDCIMKFNDLSEERESFLTCDEHKSREFIGLTKCLFDLNKSLINSNTIQKSNTFSIKKSLNELFTTGFDEEQVWQQIQLHNQPLLDLLVREVSNISVKRDLLRLNVKTKQNNNISIDSENNLNKKMDKNIEKELFSENESIDENNDNYNENQVFSDRKVTKSANQWPKSVVDDMFFRLHEVNDFLDKEDIKEEQKRSGANELMSEESDEEEIDYFADSHDSDIGGYEDMNNAPNAREVMFSDFFDAPIDANVDQRSDDSNEEESEEVIDGEIDTRDVDTSALNEEQSDEEMDFNTKADTSSDSEDEPFGRRKDKEKEAIDSNDLNDRKSEFERIESMLKEKIAKQERENLMTKSWQMSGEISSDRRPENSLLEEHLHFDHTTRPAPLITEETTVKLEDIIKTRVKDNSFDDVIRKVKPKEKPFEYRRRITMESEKSKQSLSQIYENEYLRQQQKEREEEERPEEKQIKKLMRTLFVQLDALSNFNFTPRPPQPEIKIINNLPAISAEEATPLATSDLSLLAPQEVYNNQKRELQSNAEKSETDRKRSRRLKKKIQRKKSKFNESKQMATKKKSTKVESNDSEDIKHLSSSKKFFDKLQEKTQSISKKKIKKNDSKTSNKLKL